VDPLLAWAGVAGLALVLAACAAAAWWTRALGERASRAELGALVDALAIERAAGAELQRRLELAGDELARARADGGGPHARAEAEVADAVLGAGGGGGGLAAELERVLISRPRPAGGPTGSVDPAPAPAPDAPPVA
jgi:hypothetical protein